MRSMPGSEFRLVERIEAFDGNLIDERTVDFLDVVFIASFTLVQTN